MLYPPKKLSHILHKVMLTDSEIKPLFTYKLNVYVLKRPVKFFQTSLGFLTIC